MMTDTVPLEAFVGRPDGGDWEYLLLVGERVWLHSAREEGKGRLAG